MKNLYLSIIALSITVYGCAEMQQHTSQNSNPAIVFGNAIFGCFGGTMLAKFTGQSEEIGCKHGTFFVWLFAFKKSRQEEISAVENAAQEAVSALELLPASKAVKIGQVATVEVTVTNKFSNEIIKIKVFDFISLEIPFSLKNTPEYDAAISKLKKLAEKVADERGSSLINISLTSTDAKRYKIVFETGSVLTPKGSSITVSKTADNSIQQGIERVTVRAGKLDDIQI